MTQNTRDRRFRKNNFVFSFIRSWVVDTFDLDLGHLTYDVMVR